MLKYNLSEKMGKILLLSLHLEKEGIISIKKTNNNFFIKVENVFKTQQDKKNYEKLKELNQLLTWKEEAVFDETEIETTFEQEEDKTKKVAKLSTRDIKDTDVEFFIQIYNLYSKQNIFVSASWIKKDFFLFMKNLNELDLDPFLQILKENNFNFLIDVKNKNDVRDSKLLTKFLLIMTNYINFLEESEYKYITKITNFINHKYMDYSLFNKEKTFSLINDLKRLFFKLQTLKEDDKGFFWVLKRMNIKSLQEQQQAIVQEQVKEKKPENDEDLGDILSNLLGDM